MAKNSTNGQKKSTITQESTASDSPHLQTLSKYESIYDTYIQSGEIINFHPHVRSEVVAAYRVADPHYHYNDGCAACIAEMLVTVYRYYKTQKQ